MNSKICLLLTDDPDDQQSFSNAISEIAPEIILISVIDAGHAVNLLTSKKVLADFIVVDVSMFGLDINQIKRSAHNDGVLKPVTFALYGYQEDLAAANNFSNYPYLNKDCTYSDLINFLRGVLK
jgi:hypothetical protein